MSTPYAIVLAVGYGASLDSWNASDVLAAEVAKVDFLIALTRCLAYTGKKNNKRNNRFNHLVLIYILFLE